MIRGAEGLSDAEIATEVSRGGRFVVYYYAISIVIMTFRRSSDIHFLRAGESGFGRGLPWTLLTLVLGWWGIPWGPFYSIQSIYTNLTGGHDVTNQIMQRAG